MKCYGAGQDVKSEAKIVTCPECKKEVKVTPYRKVPTHADKR